MNDLFPQAESKPISVRQALINVPDYQPPPDMSPRFKEYWERAGQGGTMGSFSSSNRLTLEKPSPTLAKSEGYGGMYHPTECRPLSSAERKRLSSFPDDFIFTDWKSCIERIGNAVPPLMTRAIALQIKAVMFD